MGEVEVVSDSELMVNQMRGEYRVKNPDLGSGQTVQFRNGFQRRRSVWRGPPNKYGRNSMDCFSGLLPATRRERQHMCEPTLPRRIHERYRDYRVRPRILVENYDPMPGYVWAPGGWQWNGAEWQWFGGHYAVEGGY